jgi:hypothetical protein
MKRIKLHFSFLHIYFFIGTASFWKGCSKKERERKHEKRRKGNLSPMHILSLSKNMY